MNSKTLFLGPMTATLLATLLFGCGDTGGGAASSSTPPSSATSKPSSAVAAASQSASSDVPAPTPIPSNPAYDEATSASPMSTKPLGEALAGTVRIVVKGPASGATGITTEKKEQIDAVLAALGAAQTLDKGFGPKCLTSTQLTFHSKDKELGSVAFCEGDTKLESGRFDGSGILKAQVEVKDAAKLNGLLKELGAMK